MKIPRKKNPRDNPDVRILSQQIVQPNDVDWTRGLATKQSPEKSFPPWWIHIWSGLVRDPTAKHYRAIRKAIWLYLYLLIVANRRDGTVFRRVDTIAAETGFASRSIHRWLKMLRDQGYITSTANGRALRIVITKWRPISKARSP